MATPHTPEVARTRSRLSDGFLPATPPSVPPTPPVTVALRNNVELALQTAPPPQLQQAQVPHPHLPEVQQRLTQRSAQTGNRQRGWNVLSTEAGNAVEQLLHDWDANLKQAQTSMLTIVEQVEVAHNQTAEDVLQTYRNQVQEQFNQLHKDMAKNVRNMEDQLQGAIDHQRQVVQQLFNSDVMRALVDTFGLQLPLAPQPVEGRPAEQEFEEGLTVIDELTAELTLQQADLNEEERED